MVGIKVLVTLALGLLTMGPLPAEAHQHHHRGTIDDLLELQVAPFVIAHRGSGENLGADASRPTENTVAAVRLGFRAGASIVEVDVQLTRDGQVVVYHDDIIDHATCLNTLSFHELRHRLPFVPSLEAVLDQARSFNQRTGSLSGLVIIELKAATPLCDPDDTQDRAIVRAVSRVVHHAGMAQQAMFASFSPALLFLAWEHAPEIARDLSISGLQLLTAAQLQDLFGYPVTVITKRPDLGLQWAEIGPVMRLPGYRSIDEVISTALLVRARVIEADLLFLQWTGAPFVDAVHAFGLKALGFTATNPTEWLFLESLGLDGIYADDVAFGVAHQAPIP